MPGWTDIDKICVYDCRDHPDPKHRGVTLRMFVDGDCVFQGPLLMDDPKPFIKSLAERLHVELQYVEPPKPAATAETQTEPTNRLSVNRQAAEPGPPGFYQNSLF